MVRDVEGQVPGSRVERQALTRLADELLPLLIARLGASGLGELEVRQDGWRVRLRRNGPNNAEPKQAAPAARPVARPAGHPERRHETAPGERGEGQAARRERGRVAITSPAVGYYQPRDGLAVGTSVREGDLLGHVDVLGVRQDVVAPETGILTVLSAQPGEAVEYGQPLARLEPEGRG
jgi:acetyl-CoA carboxylase biotin carboxyl carrier protein